MQRLGTVVRFEPCKDCIKPKYRRDGFDIFERRLMNFKYLFPKDFHSDGNVDNPKFKKKHR